MGFFLRWLALAALACAVACERGGGEHKGAAPGSAASADAGGGVGLEAGAASLPNARDAGPPPEFVGVVRGIVKLAPGAELPLAPLPTIQGLPAPSIAPCPPVDASDQRTITRAPSGGLFPAHVALTGMTAAPPHAPSTHELFIDACRLRPTLLGAVRGDSVRVTNRSEMALLPSIPGESFMRGLLRGESQDFPLKQTQTVVRCAFGSYCGESLIVATTHALYAVTDVEGRFTIEQVPLDQELTVHAWHPLFRAASAPFKLTREAREQTIELALVPNPRVAAAAKVDAGAGKPGTNSAAKPAPGKALRDGPPARGPGYE